MSVRPPSCQSLRAAVGQAGGGGGSGKEKSHKHKQIFPVTAGGGVSRSVVRGGVSRPVARDQKFMCCVRNPRNISVFVQVSGREESGSRPGGSVTGVTENFFLFVPNVYVPFLAPRGTRADASRRGVCICNLLITQLLRCMLGYSGKGFGSSASRLPKSSRKIAFFWEPMPKDPH